jgi:subtilisin-like proprotein convertase family protein
VTEPGEVVSLVVTARDNGTAPVTGVAGLLSTSTPGVSVAAASAAFPDLASGGTGTNSLAPFTFVLDPGFSCGTPVDFQIVFASNEGSWTDTFSLPTGTPGQSSFSTAASDVPKPVLDNQTVTSNLDVASSGSVVDVDVTVNITHSWDGDMLLTLVGPNGTRVTLSNHRGSSGDNYTNTIFDDEAATSITSGAPPFTGRFRPEGSLASLDGLAAAGTWKLEVSDTGTGDTGTITGWSLAFAVTSPPTCQACAPAAVGEATDLLWSAGSTTALEWSAAPHAVGYSVYRGAGSELPALLDGSDDSCRVATPSGPATGDVLVESPDGGTVHWYLVRGWNAVGEGTAGLATAGPRVQDPSGACP